MDAIRTRELVRVLRGSGGAPSGDAPVGGISTDSRTLESGEVFFALSGERFDGHDHVRAALEAGALACVVSVERARGDLATLAGRLIAVDDPLRALERLAAWNRARLPLEVTAVTGSVGKTTTKEFLRTLLGMRYSVEAAPRSFNNRLGVTLTLLRADRRTRQLVAELGTSAPGEISHLSKLARPERAVITSIAPAHLGGLGSIDGVIRAKAEVFDGLEGRRTAYLNVGMEGYERLRDRAPGTVRTFGEGRGEFAIESCRWRGGERGSSGRHEFRIQGERLELPVPGRHNVVNAAAAIAVARDAGLGWSEIRTGLAACRLPPGRLDVVRWGGLILIDDSYNANPGSVASAVEAAEEIASQDGRLVVVLGDMLELGPGSARIHEGVGRRLARSRLALLVAVGVRARHLCRGFQEECTLQEECTGRRRRRVRCFEKAEETARYLESVLEPGDRVLFKGSNRSGVSEVLARLRDRLGVSAGDTRGPQPAPAGRALGEQGARGS